MPAKPKRHIKVQEKPSPSVQEGYLANQQQNLQIQPFVEHSDVQISQAEAQAYFQYLRKKISHQSSNPFSLPFLNLKFQQLESWKGATQQLNLQSRIYGMRVDNCHDSTVKMLNYVIRHQKDQVGQSAIDIEEPKDTQNDGQQKMVKQINLHLQRPQKLNSVIQIDKNLHSRSLWKMIFKKTQTIGQIQLNTIELSNDLSLQIDQKNINYCPKQKKNNQNIEEECKDFSQIQKEELFDKEPFISQKMSIFSQIQAVKRQIDEDLENIFQRMAQRKKRRKDLNDEIQNCLYMQQYGIQDIDFANFYEEFDQYERAQGNNFKQQNQIDFSQSNQDLQMIQKEFYQGSKKLLPLAIDSNTQLFLPNQYQSPNPSQASADELYEPQKDIFFNTTLKKKKRSQNMQRSSQNMRTVIKKNRNMSRVNIEFQDTTTFKRKQVFKRKKGPQRSMNDNLIPINYVEVYECRNPFRKLKNQTKIYKKPNNIYDISHINDTYTELDPKTRFHYKIGESNMNEYVQGQEKETQNHEPLFQNVLIENQCRDSNYRSVPIKLVKSEIVNELQKDESFMMSRNISKFSNPVSSSLPIQQSIVPKDQNWIGLKYLKQKMKAYDPLDILVSMLHVAYEEQIQLQTVYQQYQIDPTEQQMLFQDIVIKPADFSTF